MEVYCSHFNRLLTKSSNYYRCNFCGAGWYGIEPVPLVVIGYTDYLEASPNYNDSFIEKDLSQKKFNRCSICKDLVEKRKHRICSIKACWKEIRIRHDAFVKNFIQTIKGFKK